jgi:hypothetical protein
MPSYFRVFGSALHIKKTPPILGPKHYKRFFKNLKHESSPLSAFKKNIGDCAERQGLSIGTALLTPSFVTGQYL